MYKHFLYLVKNLNPQEISVVEEKTSGKDMLLREELHTLFSQTSVSAFNNITDPVEWQRIQRDEW
jgi:hypothetical protein